MSDQEKKIHKKLTNLASKYNLNFTHNAGGGEFYRDGWGSCQVSTYDDIDDLIDVYEWIIKNI